MNLAAAPHFPQTPDIARRLDAILTPLAVLVATRFNLLGQWTVPLWLRLTGANRRLANLLARLAAGRLSPPRSGTPHSGPPSIHFPARRAWLVEILQSEVVAYAAQLEYLLREPATAAFLAAAPSAARTLRPLCRILGIEPPPIAPPAIPLAAIAPPPAAPILIAAPEPPAAHFLTFDEMLPSVPRTGRANPCPEPPTPQPAPPPPAERRPPVRIPQVAVFGPDGCYCANPAASPSWPFNLRRTPPPYVDTS